MNTFIHTCSHCGQVDRIDRGVAMQCPTCHVRPGSPCMDMRGKNPGVVPIAKLHPARADRIQELDRNRQYWTRPASDLPRPVLVPIAHTCTRCAEVDLISRALVAQCPACHARPGESCRSTVLADPKPMGRVHPDRADRIRELDQGYSAPVASPVLTSAAAG